MITKEHAAEIRAEIRKLHGLKPKDVSVRSDLYSMGSSIRVTIRTAAAFAARRSVAEIAEAHQHVDRCEISGDILSGGNMYVSVYYSEECREIIAGRHMDAVGVAMAACEADREANPRASGWILVDVASAPWARIARETATDWTVDTADAYSVRKRRIWADDGSQQALAWEVALAEPPT